MRLIYFAGIILAVVIVAAAGCASTLKTVPDAKGVWGAPNSKISLPVTDPYADIEVMATDLSFDMRTGEIKYTLPDPALVRLRIGMREGGPLIQTLLDWDRRDAGTHTEVWNKKDSLNLIDYTDNPNIMVVLRAVKMDAPRKENQNFRGTFHKSPDFTVEFPRSQTNEQGIPILKEKVPLRVVLNEASRDWFTKTKYEIGIYIDDAFIIEDEEANDPFTYQFDSRKINNGNHRITVNVVGYHGEIGCKSVLVLITNN